MEWRRGLLIWSVLLSGLASTASGQTDDLGLADGYISLSTANWDVKLVKDAQVLASLKSSGDSFDFLPLDYIKYRAANGQYHNGDVTFRYRTSGESDWTSGDSSQAREVVTAVTRSDDALAAADLGPTLPSNSPLQIVRKWVDVDGDLGLSFTLTNTGNDSLEVGSLGFPTEFNSIFTNRTPEGMVAKCSLTDPYIGLDAGYLQVAPTSGTGPALIVTPLGNTSTPFEAWRNLDEPYVDYTAYQSQTFEGYYEWQTHSKAYAEKEWKGVTPWNTPTSLTLKAGESATVGLRFSLVKDGIRGIQKAVRATNTPVTIGTSYVVPSDLTVPLLIQSPSDISDIVSDDGAFTISRQSNNVSLTPTGSVWGRTKIVISYADGRKQSVHYFVTDSASDVIAKLGEFSTTTMWFTDEADPFGRAPSIMTYDASIQGPLLQEARVWIAGLSDEGGVIYMATGMKQSGLPNADEVSKLEQFISGVMYPTIQDGGSLVRKSIFYYEPSALPSYSYSNSIDWGNWWSWNKAASYATDRAYDYVHVLATYWALYRAGRDDPAILKQNDWQWYLRRAYNTTVACFATDNSGNGLVGYSRVGLMGETVVGELLNDLYREGWTNEASAVEAAMKLRADAWDSQAVPFGSEMAWDSTGQEGVYYWTNYFNLTDSATKTVNSILGFMPTVSHWGWNGNARRYWDFIYAGKLQRIERMIHHYGSSLNALPLLEQFRQDPTDTYLLRVGYGGISGPLSNIRQDGSMYNAFHSFPDTLRGDDYSGDYAPTFLGVMLGSATYVVEDPDMGLVAYGGNIAIHGKTVTVQPRDALRRRVYIASMGVYITLSAGWIEQFHFMQGTPAEVDLRLVPGPSRATSTVVWVESPGRNGNYAVKSAGTQQVRGGWKVQLSDDGVQVTVGKA